jgi:hypothetical protein
MLCTSAFWGWLVGFKLQNLVTVSLTMNMGYKVNHFLEDAVTYIQPAKKTDVI